MRRRELDDVDAVFGEHVEDLEPLAVLRALVDHDTAPADEGNEERRDRQVERQRGVEREVERLALGVLLSRPPEVVHEAAVGQESALRLSRRSRGVDHVRDVPGLRPRRGHGRGQVVEQSGGEIDDGRRAGVRRDVDARGEDQRRRRVQDHRRAPRRRVRRVDRDVRGPGFQDAEDRGEGVRRPREAQRDPRALADAPREEQVGEAVRLRVELRVAERALAGRDRDGIGRSTGLRLEEVDDGRVPRVVRVRGVPLRQAEARGVVEEVEAGEPPGGVLDEAVNDRQELVEEPTLLGLAEDVAVQVEVEAERAARVEVGDLKP